MRAKKILITLFFILIKIQLNAQTIQSKLTEITHKTPILDSVLVINKNEDLKNKDREESEEFKMRKKLWYENLHLTAPNVDWKDIENKNLIDKYNANRAFNEKSTTSINYANGQLCGNWFERGSSNQAGRVIATDYDKTDNSLYVISNSGSMFQGIPDNSNWQSTNNQLAFKNNIIKIIKNSNGTKRIIGVVGLNTFYSDDNGVTFNPSAGLSFPVSWGGNYIHEIESLTDINTNATILYLVTRPWDPGPWSPRYWIYSSTDRGQTWTFKQALPNNGNDNQFHFSKLDGQENYLYGFYNNSSDSTSRLYKLFNSGFISLINTSTVIPTNTNFLITGNYNGAISTIPTLYIVAGSNNSLFKTTDEGVNWTNVGVLPITPYTLRVSPTDPNKIFTGQVNAYRSYNGGATWTMINQWYDYSGDPLHKLHADIQNIKYFKKTNNAPFGIINTDGGSYYSDDDFLTVTNISLSGLNNSEYYSVISDNQSNMFAGTQDQGLQRASNVNANTNLLSFDQIISGDYGKLQLTRNNQTLWGEYPGGKMYYYYNSTGGYTNNWDLTGTTLPTASWMLATAPVYPASLNQIYLAGGNINGGSGSYLVKLTGTSTSITATQGTYDFRGNTTTGISAIATTQLNPSKIYVAKENGSFYFSNDAGANWNQTTSFSGPAPQYLFGNCIFASKITSNFVLLGGSGYSNSGVYKSTDGGVTFSAMNNGLPATLVYGFDANATETFIYAATEAGPYVFSVFDNTWYPLNGGIAPAQTYFSVDYDEVNNIAHFGSFGRGIWDFVVCPSLDNVSFLNEKKFFIYPNPASTKVNILLNQIVNNQILLMYDANGKLITETNVSNNSEINISNLNEGIYYFKLKNYPKQTQKIIKK